ncbi:MAG TPA: methionine--tRNA ligase [bacterium]|nr:methionine--tRNA ligase [bacterium]
METFYVTTPIYYVNDVPHIGHTYTTLAADTIARWKRLAGADVFFLTGTDEHGVNIERRAREAGVAPQVWVDQIAPQWQALWKRLGISNDDFIRTTEPRHIRVAQQLFQTAYDRGAIYKGTYEGWYCTSCEAFYTEDELLEGQLCPIHKRPVQWTAEENYLFRLSQYRDWILRKIEGEPEFIQPDTQRNEMLSLVRGGLRDLAVSRLSVKWGIPVPFDPQQIIYVWVEALINYVTTIGYLDDPARYRRFWPHVHHLVGRDITRFHAVIWPCFLEAVGLPSPKQVWAHGFWTVEGEKMSKTRGNFIDPIGEITRLAEESGAEWNVAADAFRYALLREVPFGQDGNYSHEALVHRFNADLANDFGNLLNRALPIVQRHFGGQIPAPGAPEGPDGALRKAAEEVPEAAGRRIGTFDFTRGLTEIWRFLGVANKYIDVAAPWAALKAGTTARGGAILYNTLEALRIATILLTPVLPSATQRVWEQLGIAAPLAAQRLADTRWGGLPAGTPIRPGAPLFPRIEKTPALAPAARPPEATEQAALLRRSSRGHTPGRAARTSGPTTSSRGGTEMSEITIEEFNKIDLRIAEVLEAKRVAGADKLLELRIKVGETTRTLVAGIAQQYAPETLIGRKIVVVANLQPRRLRGVESQGMLLAANDGNRAILLAPDQDVPSGVRVS